MNSYEFKEYKKLCKKETRHIVPRIVICIVVVIILLSTIMLSEEVKKIEEVIQMNKNIYVQIGRFDYNKYQGGYIQKFIDADKYIEHELQDLSENESKSELRIKLIELTEEEYNNLPEFSGY